MSPKGSDIEKVCSPDYGPAEVWWQFWGKVTGSLGAWRSYWDSRSILPLLLWALLHHLISPEVLPHSWLPNSNQSTSALLWTVLQDKLSPFKMLSRHAVAKWPTIQVHQLWLTQWGIIASPFLVMWSCHVIYLLASICSSVMDGPQKTRNQLDDTASLPELPVKWVSFLY